MIKILTLLLFGLWSLASADYTWAQVPSPTAEDPKMPEVRPQVTRTISKEVATQLAQDRYPGRVLKVRTEARLYRVRVMQEDGRVVNVIVDGRNGRVRREE